MRLSPGLVYWTDGSHKSRTCRPISVLLDTRRSRESNHRIFGESWMLFLRGQSMNPWSNLFPNWHFQYDSSFQIRTEQLWYAMFFFQASREIPVFRLPLKRFPPLSCTHCGERLGLYLHSVGERVLMYLSGKIRDFDALVDQAKVRFAWLQADETVATDNSAFDGLGPRGQLYRASHIKCSTGESHV
jgi:hypothetical protein